jgi:hypothetical protein
MSRSLPTRPSWNSGSRRSGGPHWWAEPEIYSLPRPSDLRFNWICARLDKLDHAQLRKFVIEAWRMCVPKKVSASVP